MSDEVRELAVAAERQAAQYAHDHYTHDNKVGHISSLLTEAEARDLYAIFGGPMGQFFHYGRH